MTVKTILFALFLSALGLGAQPLPPTPATADATNRSEALRGLLRSAAGGETNLTTAATNVPIATPTQPGTPPPPTPAVPAAQTVSPTPAPTATPPPAPAAPAPAEEVFPAGTINWTAADINQVLTIYAEYVGRTILRPANLAAAPIVLKTQTPLTKTELIQVLNAALALNGIEMVNIGDKFVKAMPLALANAAGARINTNDASGLADLGAYTTHVVQIKYMKPSELMPVLTPFASLATAVLPIDASQIIVLRDHTENVKRMLEMIERVDVSVPSEFISEVIPIKFAKVEDIASALNSLSGSAGGTSIGARPTGTTPGGTMPGARPGYNPNQPGQFGQPGTMGAGTGTPSAGGTFSDRLNAIIKRAATSSGDLQIIGTTKIVADARSNSLLIFATRQDMAIIKDIVSKLDVVLAQVLIETIIMDVSLDDSWAFGVSAGQNPYQKDKFTGGGVYNNSGNQLNTLDQFFKGVSTSNLTSIFPGASGLSYFGRYNGELDVAVAALASDNRVNVIQKPRIQTSHATPASIFIGSTVPYVSGSYYGGGYGGTGGNSYQQLRVGIGLNVTPFINADGLVVMKIDETIDEISGSTAIVGVGDVPTTTSRTISAEVAVRDRETIMLGGFIRNSEIKGKSGIPLLKDIPLLGALFSSRSSSKERKELIVLMRPTVLRTPELAAMQVVEEKKRLPGVRAAEAANERTERAAEAANERTERKSLEREKKNAFKEKTPFTPEEVKLYGEPPTTTP